MREDQTLKINFKEIAVAVVLLMSMGYFTESFAGNDFKHVEFTLSDIKFLMPVPKKNQSKDTIVSTPVFGLNLDGVQRNDFGGVQIYRGLWDWGGFWAGGYRSLSIAVYVRAVELDQNILCFDNFSKYSNDLAAELTRRSERGSDPGFRNHFSVVDGHVKLGGKASVKMVSRGWQNMDIYMVPVSRSHYLSIDYKLLPLGRPDVDGNYTNSDKKWIDMVNSMVGEMVKGIVISGTESPMGC